VFSISAVSTKTAVVTVCWIATQFCWCKTGTFGWVTYQDKESCLSKVCICRNPTDFDSNLNNGGSYHVRRIPTITYIFGLSIFTDMSLRSMGIFDFVPYDKYMLFFCLLRSKGINWKDIKLQPDIYFLPIWMGVRISLP
jgi:hypothetical protein